MNRKPVGAAFAALVATTVLHAPALAQNEQFIPNLVYRTGAYAPNGIPFANGLADYYTLINERDGGINGVKIVFEECDTGYATDRGVECYERLKRKGPTGAAYILPLSTGITFALTVTHPGVEQKSTWLQIRQNRPDYVLEKAPVDKIPIISMGYGRSESRDGSVFQWNFPLLGTYWTAADIILQFIAGLATGIGAALPSARPLARSTAFGAIRTGHAPRSAGLRGLPAIFPWSSQGHFLGRLASENIV
jgi:branched-chain amino acid transport system substrate-binding protein